MQRWISILAAAWLVWPLSSTFAQQAGLIRIESPIGPAASGYIARAIGVAADQRAGCLIIELDTPGGLLDSTRHIVQAFYAAPIPVVVYVAPAPAGAMIRAQPIALQLRFLQTMSEMASEHNTTTIFPLPIELFSAYLQKSGGPEFPSTSPTPPPTDLQPATP